MAYEPRRNPFNPLLIGAIAVMVALAAFLIFRDGADTTQQAGIDNPPAAGSPNAGPSDPPPARTAPSEAKQPGGSGKI